MITFANFQRTGLTGVIARVLSAPGTLAFSGFAR
jgi:hypothetical protein